MSIKSDKWITRQSAPGTEKPLIAPFTPKSVNTDSKGAKIPSYGLSSYGYDVRLGRNFKLFKTAADNDTEFSVTYIRNGTEHHQRIPKSARVVDLRDFDKGDPLFVELKDIDSLVLHPGGFVLAHCEEYICVPRDVSVVAMGKSSVARAGIIVTVTPLEAGWEGITTLEITNTTRLPVRLHAGDGICQMQFHQSDEACDVSYADRGGKYQFQGKEAVTPIF